MNYPHSRIDSSRFSRYDSALEVRYDNNMGQQAMKTQIDNLLKNGGEFDAQSDLETLRAQLEQAGLACFMAECSKARNRSAVFRAVAKAVDYPEFFGSSLEGLYDCLTDTISEQRVGVAMLFQDLHSADPDLEAVVPQIQEVLNEAVDYARDQNKVFLYGIQHGGKHPDAVPGVVHAWSDVAE